MGLWEVKVTQDISGSHSEKVNGAVGSQGYPGYFLEPQWESQWDCVKSRLPRIFLGATVRKAMGLWEIKVTQDIFGSHSEKVNGAVGSQGYPGYFWEPQWESQWGCGKSMLPRIFLGATVRKSMGLWEVKATQDISGSHSEKVNGAVGNQGYPGYFWEPQWESQWGCGKYPG